MAKGRDEELNKGTSGSEEFTLEEILAEFGGGSARRSAGKDGVEIPAPPRRPRTGDGRRDNVVEFPGRRAGARGQAETAAPRIPSGAPPKERPDRPAEDREAPNGRRVRPTQAAPDSAPSRGSSGASRKKEDPIPPTEDRAAPFRPAEGTENPRKGRRESPPAAREGAGDGAPEEKPGEKVVDFPGEEETTFFAEKLNALRKRADEYAEHMFEQEGIESDPEVRRAEKYIPGVDEEPTAPLRERPPRRLPRPAPDLSADELYRRYHSGLKLLRLRAVLVILLAVPMLYLTLWSYAGAPLPGALAESYSLQLYVLAGLLGAAMLLGVDQLLLGLLGMLRLKMGLDSLTALACIATLADTLTVERLSPRDGQLPCCAVCVLGLGLQMWGAYLKRKGQRLTCRTAAAAHDPYLVTLDEGKWSGRDTYTKWSGESAGFGSQIQADDGAERIFHVAAPLLLIACLLFSVLASIGRERPGYLLWCLSTTLTAASTFSGSLCFGIPWNALARRLGKCGAALAGWDGAAGTAGAASILLTDTDLFPPGSVAMNGIKVFGDFSVEKVVGYAATLIRASGSGLDKVFHDLLRTQGAIYRRCDGFQYHEGGGVSAVIRNEAVLVGSAAFMHLMDIPLPRGLNVKNAVFCAIDGDLAGIFALNYSLHAAVRPSLNALIRNRVKPVLVTRDFNLTPAMLRQRFKLPVEKMEYPPVERRVELNGPDQDHSVVLTAVLCREGLFPFSEAVVGAQRLRLAVRLSAAITAVGGAVGALLAFYLTFVEAYASLSPVNLLIFLVMWMVPTLLISGWVDRY